MSGKLEFGCDYLNLMRNLQLIGEEGRGFNPIVDAAAKLFLLNWGFSVAEVDEANDMFFDRLNSHTLEYDLSVVSKRITDHIQKDRIAQERLVTELAAIGALDMNITVQEEEFVGYFQNLMDMRPSEFSHLLQRGTDWAVALNYFGEQYGLAKAK